MKDLPAFKRAARGLDISLGSATQGNAAMKCFGEFLAAGGLAECDIDQIYMDQSTSTIKPRQNMYSLLTAFSIFLLTKRSDRSRSIDGTLSKATSLGYFSQVENMLRERYNNALTDSKRVAKIRDSMASAIDDRNLRANI